MYWGNLLALSPLQVALAIPWPEDGHVHVSPHHLLWKHCQPVLRVPPFAKDILCVEFWEHNVPSRPDHL